MDLNDNQKACVNHLKGAALVLAGPGTGKTRILICRYEKLVQDGVNPHSILCITFSNKAANEIMNRLSVANLDYGISSFGGQRESGDN